MNLQKTPPRALPSQWAVGVLCAYAWILGGFPVAQAQDAANGDADGLVYLEEVLVTGTRTALRSGIDAKRAADNFSDVIKAEDIGELPDANLAESLQRITGVQIVRDNAASREQQSGQVVNIRGLPTLAVLNGRTMLPGGTASRDFDFRSLASEGFSELVISKSPTADRIEGGVGGTIELNTRNPLEFEQRTLSFTGTAARLGYAETTNPDLSALYADKFADGRVGVVVSGSYQDLDTRTDAYTARGGWTLGQGFAGSGFDTDNDGTEDAILPSDIRYWYQNDKRERLGLNGTFVLAASDNLNLTVDVNYAKFDRDFYNGVFRTAGFSAANAVPGSTVIDSDGSLVAGSFNNVLVQSDGRLEVDDVETIVYGFKADWSNDRWSLSFDVARMEGSNDGRQLINRYRLLNGANVTYDFRGQTLPSVVLDGGATNPADRSLYRPDLAFNNPEYFDNSETSSRLDVAYDFAEGFLTRASAGLRYTNSGYERMWFLQNGGAGGSCANSTATGGFWDPAGTGLLVASPVVCDPATGQFLPASNSALDPLLGGGFPVGDFFSGKDGAFPRAWVYTDYPGGNGNGPGAYGDVYRLSPSAFEWRDWHTDIDEETLAGYARLDFGSEVGDVPIRGNFGVRVVRTDVGSTSYQTQQDGGLALEKEKSDYTNVLPSLTVIADLQEDLLLRFAAGRTMRRPGDLNDLRSRLAVETSSGLGTNGNVALKPLVATQVDLGLEWYFAEDGLLSGTVFYKDVKDFVSRETETNVEIPRLTNLDNNTSLFTITRPVNTGTADIVGFEISYQQAFTQLPGLFKNLGVFANFTFTDLDTDTVAIQDFVLSKRVYNLVGYYDDGRLDARLAWNWRSKYAYGGDGANGIQAFGFDEVVKASGQLDFSLNYAITENFDLLFEVFNITESDFERYAGVSSRLREFRTGERRFNFGVRATF